MTICGSNWPNRESGWMLRLLCAVMAILFSRSILLAEGGDAVHHSFRFDGQSSRPDQTVVTGAYSEKTGYGFEDMTGISQANNCTSSDKPFYFSVRVPQGDYHISVTFGDDARASQTSVKAELRRLMLLDVEAPAGGHVTRDFSVNVRTPEIAGGGKVHLKTREQAEEVCAWDNKLTLEFNGHHPAVRSIDIEKVEIPTIYLLGDSTVCDQSKEPWNSWGQMLTYFFNSHVAISNQAESGETLRGALHAQRVAKVLGDMKNGDYLFIQFGHNDQKEKGQGVGAFAGYKSDLESVVTDTRNHGGVPVLVTSMNRKRFDSSGKVINTLGDYPDAVRAVAKEMNVPLIDLNAMSKTLYEAIGKDKIDRAFVDGTHHDAYGSYELARCVVEGIRANKLDCVKYLRDDTGSFDPAHPDSIEAFQVEPSPNSSTVAPLGN